MFFCPNCNNIFDVTKTPTNKTNKDKVEDKDKDIDIDKEINKDINKDKDEANQVGGSKDYLSIINKIINNEGLEKTEVEKLLLDDLIKDASYKKLTSSQKELVYNKIQQMLPVDKELLQEQGGIVTPDKAYFICKNCGFLKPISDNTLIFSRVSSDVSQSYTSSDISEMAYSDILPRTRKYICTNDKCISHKDPSKREACFFRMNNSYKIKYICLACNN